MADIDVIKDCITRTSPRTATAIPWEELESALLVTFTGSNTGDLHYDVRSKKGFNVGSNKTHIDVTSGGDVAVNLSPATDFFVVSGKKVQVPVLLHGANIEDISKTPQSSLSWSPDTVTVNTLQPRNVSANPSIQLLEKTDIEQIRLHQSIGDCLIFLKKLDGEILSISAKSTGDISTIMGRKTKRMFRFSAPKHRPVMIPSNDDGDGIEPEASSRILGRKNRNRGRGSNPALNSAIENHGVAICEKFFIDNGFTVTDVSKPELASKIGLDAFPGFDQLAIKGDTILGVEIKATSTPGEQVNISSNELAAAIADESWRLGVVRNIEIVDAEKCEVRGGEVAVYRVSKPDKLQACLERITEAVALAEKDGLSVSPSYNLNVVPDLLEIMDF